MAESFLSAWDRGALLDFGVYRGVIGICEMGLMRGLEIMTFLLRYMFSTFFSLE